MKSDTIFLMRRNAEPAGLSEVPEAGFSEFYEAVTEAVNRRDVRISAFFALPEIDGSARLIAVLADPAWQCLRYTSTRVGERYRALTAAAPAFHWFEREIAEQYGIVPEGHPWLKPLRFHRSWSGRDAWGRGSAEPIAPGVTDYFRMTGDAVHEVAVGPVHAGVIEPGHFRFQCLGEDVFSLEIELGYQHRGIERMLEGGPDRRTMHLLETASGDASVAQATAGASVLEALAGLPVAPEAKRLRATALELERIANHIGDLGALAGDVAFLPTASFCGRIRGDVLNLTAELCGNRFGRGIVTPGGVRTALESDRRGRIRKKLEIVRHDLWPALDLMFDSPTVLDRLENTGTVSGAAAAELGLVGVAARASGLTCDVRAEFPVLDDPARTRCPEPAAGDVMARAAARYADLRGSFAWLMRELEKTETVPVVPAAAEFPRLAPDSIVGVLVEAWRGELCHVAVTGAEGRFRRYKIVDPSFHNWFGLAMALRNEQISNFPICNKSFNLSYCGHDL